MWLDAKEAKSDCNYRIPPETDTLLRLQIFSGDIRLTTNDYNYIFILEPMITIINESLKTFYIMQIIQRFQRGSGPQTEDGKKERERLQKRMNMPK